MNTIYENVKGKICIQPEAELAPGTIVINKGIDVLGSN